MAYELEGILLEVCTCNVLCPCWVGEDPDGGTCDGLLGWHFESGTIEGVDVSGRTFVIMAHIPGNIMEGDWRAVVYIDDGATDAQQDAITSANNQFPFNFVGSPPSVGLQISIPIFQGLSRQRNLEAARLQRDDLVERVREQELALEADLAIGLANARTLYQSALLEERNRELADQQLRLARERYQLGAITFVELVDAQTVLAQAEADRIGAVFAYHDSVTTLEALVGTSLRF